ncbi:S-layer homology domain-containing protein [Anaerobacillus isosaccharinicus]|uniref:Autolysin n=2 Tax=Anaerobacillus isosaccharinicus TaxID=1532552 RepID=A0A1S2LAG0_9BACI|nr:S-layer homology domain-containing protein [Anaerobacillus isosaccharinicus]MBA5584591.1 S-layer homology domain-containing protein [Anaerobacillus isosaccharinicus]
MTKIQDIRSQTPKRSTTRPETNINKVVRHHSGTTSGDFWIFWNGRWMKLGWIVGGYHEIILTDGTVQLCYDPNMITNGVAGHNSRSYHICVVGNGVFTAAQEKAWEERCKLAMKRFNLKASDVVGHGELTPSACPGINMNTVRSRLGKVNPIEPTFFSNAFGRDCSRFVCKGPSIVSYQNDLMAVGEKLPRFGADGDFGQETEDATKAFQSRHGLVVDGIAGPTTLSKIEELIKLSNKGPFPDVPKNHWASEAIETVKEAGIMNGFADGTFKPNEPVTRAQLATVVANIFKNKF